MLGRRGDYTGHRFDSGQRFLDWLARGNEKLLDLTLRRPGTSLLATAIVFMCSTFQQVPSLNAWRIIMA